MLSNKSFKLLTILVVILDILSTTFTSEEIFNDGFLQDFNEKLQNSLNDIYSCLGITKTQRTNMETIFFMSMHRMLTKISKKNFKSYEEMVNVTKIKEYKPSLPDINDILKDVLVEKMEAIYNSFNISHNPSIIKGETQNVSTYLYNRFLDEIRNITTNGFVLPLRQTRKRKVRMKPGIQVWKPSNKQINGNFTRRIYRSIKTRIQNYPFMASIHWNGEFICGGSIISEDLILSAASCLQLTWNNRLYREFPNHLAARVGSSYVGHAGELIQVIEVYFHPEYNPKTLQHNLVALRIGRHMHFAGGAHRSRIKYIGFNRSPTPLPTNVNKLVIVGWGTTQFGNQIRGQGVQKLQSAALPFYNLADCKDIYSKVFVTNYNFCAGFITIGTGACNRDVGNPAILDDILVGVVSFGSPVCGTPNAPTVFTKIGFYEDWLETIMDLPSASYPGATTKARPVEKKTTTIIRTTTRAMVQPIFNKGKSTFLTRNGLLKSIYTPDSTEKSSALPNADEMADDKDATTVNEKLETKKEEKVIRNRFQDKLLEVPESNEALIEKTPSDMPEDIIKDLLTTIVNANSFAKLKSFLYGDEKDALRNGPEINTPALKTLQRHTVNQAVAFKSPVSQPAKQGSVTKQSLTNKIETPNNAQINNSPFLHSLDQGPGFFREDVVLKTQIENAEEENELNKNNYGYESLDTSFESYESSSSSYSDEEYDEEDDDDDEESALSIELPY